MGCFFVLLNDKGDSNPRRVGKLRVCEQFDPEPPRHLSVGTLAIGKGEGAGRIPSSALKTKKSNSSTDGLLFCFTEALKIKTRHFRRVELAAPAGISALINQHLISFSLSFRAEYYDKII